MTSTTFYRATYRLISAPPASMAHGEWLLLTIELANRGEESWPTSPPNPVRLSYRWRAPGGHVVVADGLRAELPHPVAPGEQIAIELRVWSPPAPGEYELVIDLLQEHVAWFADRGAAPLVLPLRFEPHAGPSAAFAVGDWRADAAGEYLLAQLETLRAAGYVAMVLAESIDPALPIMARRHAIDVRLHNLRAPRGLYRDVADRLRAADLLIVHDVGASELAHAALLATRALVFVEYQPGLAAGNPAAALGYADRALVHLGADRAQLLRDRLVAAERIAELPYPLVDQPRQAARDPALAARYGLSGRRVLYCPGPAPEPRLLDLVSALARLRRSDPSITLLLDFEPGAAVRCRADELGCADSLVIRERGDTSVDPAGTAPRDDLLAISDLAIALQEEGPIAPQAVAAMGLARPVVAIETPVLARTLGGGPLIRAGDEAALAAAIERLLETQPTAADLGSPSEAELDAIRSHTIAFVTPRYGLEVLGGAERLARSWAEQLAARGFRVEALTTCNRDLFEWRDHYPAGVEMINGVAVRRFPVTPVEPSPFHEALLKAGAGERLTRQEEERFVLHNLRSDALMAYLHEHAGELACAILAPYLFGTTYWGARALPEKAILLPCLHDEPIAFLSIFRQMLEGAAGIFYNAAPERRLAEERLGVLNRRALVAGNGFDVAAPPGDGAAFRAQYGLPEPLLLYSGRVEQSKNVPLLIDYFARYKSERPGPFTLALTGTGDVEPPPRADIMKLGLLPEDQMSSAFAAATALCQPSLNESFSIVLMESWLQGRPVLVHANCAVTHYHVVESGGGWSFADYGAFRDALDQLLGDPAGAAARGARGRTYVERNYAWDVVVERILSGIAAFAGPRCTARP